MSTMTDPLPHDRLQDVEVVATVAFWSAIALPALYVPLLALGLDTRQDLALFLALFALHVVALVAGRSYGSR